VRARAAVGAGRPVSASRGPRHAETGAPVAPVRRLDSPGSRPGLAARTGSSAPVNRLDPRPRAAGLAGEGVLTEPWGWRRYRR